MEAQLKTVEAGQARESQQRFIGGTITAVVLAVAFVLLAFTAVSDRWLGWSNLIRSWAQ